MTLLINVRYNYLLLFMNILFTKALVESCLSRLTITNTLSRPRADHQRRHISIFNMSTALGTRHRNNQEDGGMMVRN